MAKNRIPKGRKRDNSNIKTNMKDKQINKYTKYTNKTNKKIYNDTSFIHYGDQ
jgi:hypothetical protein